MNVFVRMLREVYGISSGIVEAPPRISLKMFGGPFDIEAFRSQKNVCYILHPPFVSYCMLIEERQPILSIGEDANVVNTKGTVKGLRRPDPGTVNVVNDDFSKPDNEGLYSNFLSKKDDLPDASEPVAKKTRREKSIGGKEKSMGLERFMTSKDA